MHAVINKWLSLQALQNVSRLLTNPAIALIIFGAFLFIIGFCGCLGALLEVFILLVLVGQSLVENTSPTPIFLQVITWDRVMETKAVITPIIKGLATGLQWEVLIFIIIYLQDLIDTCKFCHGHVPLWLNLLDVMNAWSLWNPECV